MDIVATDEMTRPPSRKGLAACLLEKEAKRIFHQSASRALELIAQAVRYDPDIFSMRVFYVKCLMQTGYNKTALRVAEENAKRWPNQTSLWQLTVINLLVGRTAQAIEAAERRLQISADCRGFEIYAKALMAAGDLKSAETAIRRAIELCEGYKLGNNQMMLAEILRKQKKYQGALVLLRQIDEPSVWLQTRICQAQCYLELKKYNSALALLQQAELRLENENATGVFDIRFRLYCCYIFMYERLYDAGGIIPPYIKGIAARAAGWLRARRTARLGQLQVRDFKNAMAIIAKLQIK